MKPITATASNATYGETANANSVGVRVALALLRVYKLVLSPVFRGWGSCRFLPTCADYAAIAIERHGVARGSWLAIRRLARCHPFCAAGDDPVPN